MRYVLAILTTCMPLACGAGAVSGGMVDIPAGSFESVLPPAPTVKQVAVNGFRIDAALVSNAQFAAFAKSHPEWQRDRAPRIFTDPQYLQHWQSAIEPGRAI